MYLIKGVRSRMPSKKSMRNFQTKNVLPSQPMSTKDPMTMKKPIPRGQFSFFKSRKSKIEYTAQAVIAKGETIIIP